MALPYRVADPALEARLEASRLRGLGVTFPVMAGPMAAVSHVGFRKLLRRYCPPGVEPLIFMEMLSTRRMPQENVRKVPALRVAEGERGFIPQLLGNEERFIAPSVAKMLPLSPFGIDINMGCPARPILKHNWGVRLMGDKAYAAEVVAITRRHCPLPLSVKLRGGPGDEVSLPYLLEFTAALQDAGADWLTIHPRARTQALDGQADFSILPPVREALRIPVVANGDIQTSADVLRFLRESPLDGVMVARALIARPWLFWQVAEDLGVEAPPLAFPGRKAPRTPEEEGRAFVVSQLELLELLAAEFDDEAYVVEAIQRREELSIRWIEFGHYLWRLCMRCHSVAALREALGEVLEKHVLRLEERVVW